MTTLTEQKQKLIEELRRSNHLQGVEVAAAYSGERHGAGSSHIFVGIDRIELCPAGFGGFWGHAGDSAQQGTWAEVTFVFSCRASQEEDCHALFEKLCQTLLESPFGFAKLWCEGVAATKNGAGNVLSAKALLTVALTFPTQSLQFDRFVLKRSEN